MSYFDLANSTMKFDDGRPVPAELAEFLEMDITGLNEDDDDASVDVQAELADLVAASVKSNRRPHSGSTTQASIHRRPTTLSSSSRVSGGIVRRLFGNRRSRQLMAIIAIAFLVLFLAIPSSTSGSKLASNQVQSKDIPESARYQCPVKQKVNTNGLRTQSNSVASQTDFDAFVKTYRDREMDHWGHSYIELKKSMAEWKSSKFAPFLSKNSTIYDASLGVGLNLILTLEVLKESAGLSNIVVCGSDVQKSKVDAARYITKQLLPDFKGRYGKFCQADSTLLHEFVPENSFDVVYAGRIPPLANPLNLKGKQDDLDRQYNALCSGASSKQNQEKLKQEQARQIEWYTTWVHEMLRIAKPGAPVILEQVSLPLCEAHYDFGGVPIQFWNSSLTGPIQPGSVVTETSKLIKERYHVFMRKKK